MPNASRHAKPLREWGYVACSRARLETRLYLADHDTLECDAPLHRPDPAGPLERAARALDRPAAEPLALDHAPERRDTVLKLVGQQQTQIERQRERSTRQLASARGELEQLRSRDRRAELQAEIRFHRQALDRVDKKHEQLRRTAEEHRRKSALTRGCDELTRSPRPELPARTPAIKLERDRGFGIER